MRYALLFSVGSVALALEVAAQTAVDVVRPEEQQKARRAVVKEQEKRAKHASIIEFRGQQAFADKELRSALKEEITTVEDFGLKWDERLTRRAAIWLAGTVNKPLLKLTEEDYNEHGLQDLLASREGGGAYEINIEVFRSLQKTITGWPGGKPDEESGVRSLALFMTAIPVF